MKRSRDARMRDERREKRLLERRPRADMRSKGRRVGQSILRGPEAIGYRLQRID